MDTLDETEADHTLIPAEGICGPAEVTALSHLYRAEVYRSTVWRQRLDQTTNWAVISTGIGLSVAFANERASPFPIVLVGMLCGVFLMLEARRYRFFYVWRFRARVLEIAFMVPILRGEGVRIRLDRGTALSDDYMKPEYRISMIRCIGRRLRRNYGYIFAILGAAYFAKIAIHPVDVTSWEHLFRRAHTGHPSLDRHLVRPRPPCRLGLHRLQPLVRRAKRQDQDGRLPKEPRRPDLRPRRQRE